MHMIRMDFCCCKSRIIDLLCKTDTDKETCVAHSLVQHSFELG